jgi:NADPH:quinone reductase-like Zn-dependent oxidoreductase
MKALIRERYGPPDVLEVREVERPVPKEGEVLIRVRAASLNDWDWGLLHGPSLPLSRAAPKPILGSDIAGRITDVGSGVQHFRVGDDVHGDLSRVGSGGWGGFAEYVCARERALVRKPAGMTFEQAAALPQAGQLAVQGLRAGGPLKPGTIGVQLAKLHDVEVTGVDRASKHDVMRSVGFDHVIDYEHEDFTRNGRRYDLILDTKTNRRPSDYVRSLNPGGTYATVGGPLIGDLFKVAIFGLWTRPTMNKTLRLVALTPNRDLPYLNERFEAGQLVPVIDGSYRLSDAREAFRRFGAGHHKGKIVFTIE